MVALGSPPNLLMAVYDAAVDDAAWCRLPSVISEVVGGESASLWFGDRSGLSLSTYNHEPAKHQMYADHYRMVDPWMAAVNRHSLFSSVQRGSDLISDHDLKRTDFYSDFMFPTRTGPVLGCTLPLGASRCAVAVYRSIGDSEFSDAQKSRLQDLLPHLGQAVRIRSRFHEQQGSSKLAYDALATLKEAVVVCDERGVVLYANESAESLAVEVGCLSLGSSETSIGIDHHPQGARLRALIADAAKGGPGGALCAVSPMGSRLFFTASPLLSGSHRPSFGRALVIIRCEGNDKLPTIGCLRDMFGLTIREAEIALGLLANLSLKQMQEDRGVSENTIRTQITHILSKTATANQRELVRLLGSLPVL